MTHEEAVKVAEVIQDVDGGCGPCVASAMCGLHDRFPEHDWPALIAAAGFDNYGRGASSGEQRLREDLADRW